MKITNDKQNMCPYCGHAMESGYIQCRDGVVWTKKKRPIAAIGPVLQPYVVLAPAEGVFSGGAVRADCCSHCKKIIIDYAAQP